MSRELVSAFLLLAPTPTTSSQKTSDRKTSDRLAAWLRRARLGIPAANLSASECGRLALTRRAKLPPRPARGLGLRQGPGLV
jgi:hypothetical protein